MRLSRKAGHRRRRAQRHRRRTGRDGDPRRIHDAWNAPLGARRGDQARDHEADVARLVGQVGRARAAGRARVLRAGTPARRRRIRRGPRLAAGDVDAGRHAEPVPEHDQWEGPMGGRRVVRVPRCHGPERRVEDLGLDPARLAGPARQPQRARAVDECREPQADRERRAIRRRRRGCAAGPGERAQLRGPRPEHRRGSRRRAMRVRRARCCHRHRGGGGCRERCEREARVASARHAVDRSAGQVPPGV